MNTPPLLLGAAIVFWGWQTGFLLLAVLVATLLELSPLIPWRWELSLQGIRRLWMLCLVVLAGVAAYLATTANTAQAILTALQWSPLTMLPLMAAQAYGSQGAMDVRQPVFSIKTPAAKSDHPSKLLNLAYPYLALCLLAAGMANLRTWWFYAGLCVFTAWALWATRPRIFSSLTWVGLLAVAMVVGYAGHLGLHALRGEVEQKVVQWFSGAMSGGQADPSRSHTAIGHLGNMKLSDEIVMRVTPENETGGAILLHEASFNRYSSLTWFARDVRFDPVKPEPDGTTWALQRSGPSDRSMEIASHLSGGSGILALPHNASRIERLPVGGLQRNRLGAVKVEGGPSLIAYEVWYGSGGSRFGLPTEADLSMPAHDAPVVNRMATELGLRAQRPRQALQSVSAYFQNNFHYSLFQGERPLGASPLEEFLLRTKSGHCEYFATATVLLLRAAGVPARYAVGYAVQEYSPLEQRFIVRSKHAHSWAQVYVEGAWEDFDTTPSSWFEIERQTSSWWKPLSDFWSWGLFRAGLWLDHLRSHGLPPWIGWLSVPFLVVLLWGLFRALRTARHRTQSQPATPPCAWPGMDSELYSLERKIAELDRARPPWEPLSRWLGRIHASQSWPMADAIPEMLRLHYRYRFDPNGLTALERKHLATLVQSSLEQVAGLSANLVMRK